MHRGLDVRFDVSQLHPIMPASMFNKVESAA